MSEALSKEQIAETKALVETASKEAQREIAQAMGMELPKNITDTVMNSILSNIKSGRARVPQNFDLGNALKGAYYILSNTVDRNKQSVLQTCSTGSIANSLLYMAVKGLDPSKDQVYFIPYGGLLQAMPSYFGNIAMVKRLAGYETDPIATIIYKGDKVKMGHTDLGEEVVLEHETSFENKSSGEYRGAYATINFDGKLRSCVMTMDDIKESWSMSKTNKEHKEFTTEFMKRTIINRLLKPILKSSDDANLFVDEPREANYNENVVQTVSATDFEDDIPEAEDVLPEPEEQQIEVNPETGEITAKQASLFDPQDKGKNSPY